MNPLFLICGLPGSGKTTMARNIAPSSHCFAADDYFELDGSYRFSPQLVPDAHNWCQRQVKGALETARMRTRIAVHNTFCEMWELEPYLRMAEEAKRPVVIVRLFDRGLTDELLVGTNTHGVPGEVIGKMRARWVHNLGFEPARGGLVIPVYDASGPVLDHEHRAYLLRHDVKEYHLP